ncbi:hypothetical protein [Actinomadura sp. 9N407]|uniref:hypothetical protein n=1 Tax=Actinomadura sp. 9N407 TaxID=3375154 RepID=UPI00379933BB
MTVFHCARCGAALTGPVRRVPLPDERWIEPPHWSRPRGVQLMGPGVYAVDPEPFGRQAVRSTYLLAPGEVRARLIPDKCEIGCLGVTGYRGPNTACVTCGAEIGSRSDDCTEWQQIRLYPDAVRAERTGDRVPERDVEEVLGRAPNEDDGTADWLWFARLAIGAAGVLARSGGLPIRFGERAMPVHDFLSGALKGGTSEKALRPAEGAAFAFCDLVTTGLDGPEGASRLIGLVRQGSEPPAGCEAVPLNRSVWAYLADDPSRTARTHWRPGLAAIAHRDEPVHRASAAEFVAQGRFPGRLDLRDVLAGRPERGEPWLAALLEEVGGRAYL